MAEEEQAAAELAEWMAKLKLTQYKAEAEAWRHSNGAASVEEIRDVQAEFAAHLKLKKLEIRRIEKYFEENQVGGSGGGYPGTTSNSSISISPVGAASATSLPDGWTHKIGVAPDEYAMYKELGSGATAKVYECRKVTEPSQARAVKAIDLRTLRMQKDYKKLTQVLNREMQILLSLQHPRIVQLYNVFDTEDKLYLIMECLRGGELFDYIITRGTLSERGARRVFVQVADGLRHVHSKDIVYRDLKPENILLVAKPESEDAIEIKLSDFGHSKLVNDGFSMALTRVGTPQYWAPEVQDAGASKKGYDKSVDLWSLGVVLYVMLMGAYPFDSARGPVEHQMRDPKLPFRSPVNGALASDKAQDLVSSLIKFSPKARLSLDSCFQHPWTQGEGSSVQPERSGPKYCAFHLPTKPTREVRDAIVNDLLHFQKKFRCFAQVRMDKVVADLSNLQPNDVSAAKFDLKGIVKCHIKCDPMETMEDSLGSALQPVAEGPVAASRGQLRTQTTYLRVGPDGAGIILDPENGGMRVQGIEPNPGQENIEVNDLIVKINGQPLVGDPQRVEDIFGSQYGNGVELQIKRWVQ